MYAFALGGGQLDRQRQPVHGGDDVGHPAQAVAVDTAAPGSAAANRRTNSSTAGEPSKPAELLWPATGPSTCSGIGSGGSGQTVSPSTPSGSRLVATTLSSEPPASSDSTRSAQSASTGSRPAASSIDRPRVYARSAVAAVPVPGAAHAQSVEPMWSTTWAPSLAAVRSLNHTPSG